METKVLDPFYTMKTYTITTESTTIRTYEVKATSEDEARQKFKEYNYIEHISEEDDGEKVVEIKEA